MHITDIEATPVVIPTPKSVDASNYTKAGRGTTVVTLETDGDVTGHVHSGDILDSNPERAGQLKSFIEDCIAPEFVGQKLLTVERGWQQAFEKTSTFSAYNPDARQLFVHALGAVDIACWDAIGKALDQPLYKLWGGYRDSLPAIAIGGYYQSGDGLEDLAADVAKYADLGFGGIKLKVGGRSVERDLERLAVVVDATPDGFLIMCDANQGYTTDQAVSFAEGACDYEIQWFEEPVAWHDQYRGMREVRQRTGIPVAAGQSESSLAACRCLVENEVVDVVNLDASIAGGPTQWLKAAHLAVAHNVTMAHHEEPHVAMHLLAAIPNGRYAEAFHPDVDPVWWDLLTDRPEIRDGVIDLPDTPGLGVDLDDDLVAEHAVDLDDA